MAYQFCGYEKVVVFNIMDLNVGQNFSGVLKTIKSSSAARSGGLPPEKKIIAMVKIEIAVGVRRARAILSFLYMPIYAQTYTRQTY